MKKSEAPDTSAGHTREKVSEKLSKILELSGARVASDPELYGALAIELYTTPANVTALIQQLCLWRKDLMFNRTLSVLINAVKREMPDPRKNSDLSVGAQNALVLLYELV